MNKLIVKSDPRVKSVFNAYPDFVRQKMLDLREMVIETAMEMDEVEQVEETLKWGEPSYLNKAGSTLRMDWKAKTPDQYALYFKCTSKLVETFRSVYKNDFNYEGNRAIVFGIDDQLDKKKIKSCIRSTLRYHKVKKLHLLGLDS